MTPPLTRDDLGKFLNGLGLTGTMVEVGSAWGEFARKIVATWDGARLVLVDPWRKQAPGIYLESTNDTAPFDEWFGRCVDCSQEDPRRRVSLLRMLSADAAPIIAPESLDCVYLDGNHAYDAVLEDLTLWWPKVKPGGVFGGHDFYNAFEGGHFCEVEKAFKAWVGDRPYTETSCRSWWMRKP